MNHEFIHYLRVVGLIKESEWKILTNFAKKTYSETMTQNPDGLRGVVLGYESFYDRQKDTYFGTAKRRGYYTKEAGKKFPDIDDPYKDNDRTSYRDIIEEEAVAELFANYTKNKELFDVSGNKVKVTGKPKSLFERITKFYRSNN